jgi:hypothetical protein
MINLLLAAAAFSAEPDCASIKENQARLACFDAPKQEFGVVSGRIAAISASSRPHPIPTKVILIPYPLEERAKQVFREHGLSSVNIEYSDIPGLMKGSAAPDGEFRIAHVPARRYLTIIFSNAFSMKPSGSGCASWTEGALEPAAGPNYMSSCQLLEVHPAEESSIFETLRGSAY